MAQESIGRARSGRGQESRSTLHPAIGLTPQEYQIAHRASIGASNTEIAAHLLLSRKTVQYHLGNVYRKLSLRNRTELAKTLAPVASNR